MAAEPVFVGADWEGGAWLATAFGPAGHESTRVFEEVGALWGHYGERARRVVVSVPIGLPEDDHSRGPEALARELLGEQAGTVLPVPVREATRKRTYRAANRVHRRRAGAELPEAAFERAPPIAALDELLGEIPEAREAFAESHPELCFRAFVGDPLEEPPGTAAGYAERMRALVAHDRDAPPTVQAVAEGTAGEAVSVRSVLAATALAYTARPGDGELRTLPPDPERDARGLPMALCYRAAAPFG